MTYVNFAPDEIFVVVNGVWLNSPNQKAVAIKVSAIDTVRFEGETVPVARVTYSSEEGFGTSYLYVSKTSVGVQALINDSRFLYVEEKNAYRPTNNGGFAQTLPIIINRSRIVSVTDSGQSTSAGNMLYVAVFTEAEAFNRLFVIEGIAGSITNQPAPVEFQKTSGFIHINQFTGCYDISFTNHTTGETNTFHTPHNPDLGWFVQERLNITPEGGFMPVFRNNNPDRTFIYFFDASGNLVDQIDGFGPGYQWGNLSHRMTWAADNELGGSVVKFFDGVNVRTYEFPYLAYFVPDWSNEEDVTKNLYISFIVVNGEDDYTEKLYLSTPGSGLVDMNIDEWFSNDRGYERWTALTESSPVIVRASDDNDGYYTALDVFTENGVLINTLDLTGRGFTDYNDRDFYGENGNFYVSFYGDDVDYLFISYDTVTNKFSTFAIDGIDLNTSASWREWNTHDKYNGRSNSVITFNTYGTVSSSGNGFFNYEDGVQINWASSETNGWNSWLPNDGREVNITAYNHDAIYGAYPSMIWTNGEDSTYWWAILQPDGTVAIGDTGVAINDVTQVSGDDSGENTVWRLFKNTSEIVWLILDDASLVFGVTTTDQTTYNISSGTVAVSDSGNVANSWAYSPTAGDIAFPALNVIDNFWSLETSYGGAHVNPFAYNTYGTQVLIERTVDGYPVGFYFLDTNSTDWLHVINTLNDEGTFEAYKGDTRFFYSCLNAGSDIWYTFSYNIADGSLVAAAAIPATDFSNYGENYEGDRYSFYVEYNNDGIRNFYGHTTTGIALTPVNTNLNWYNIFNDATWSTD